MNKLAILSKNRPERLINIIIYYVHAIYLARTSGEWGIGEWGDIMCGDMTPSSNLRAEKLSRRFFCHRFLFLVGISSSSFPLHTNARILFSAVSTVWSSILAMQTLNQPASLQWKEEPGETLSFTWLIITLHKAISPSKVRSLIRWRKSIQT